MGDNKKSVVKWGILGTGWIAQQFADDLAYVENAECLAVGSRSLESASQFADAHGAARAYGSYEELAADADVDVIYVATPHPFHKDNTLTSLLAGKAVLCEKPFTVNSAELEEMIKLAREKKLFLMEAMWTRFLPSIVKVREWIRKGRIGEVQLVKAEFGFKMDWNPEHRLLNPDLGGGALLDTGIYPVSFASMIFGAAPKGISSTSRMGTTGVDEQFSILLDYGSGKSALLSGAISLGMTNDAYIYGTEGYIRIPSFLNAKTAALHVGEEEAEVFTDNRQSAGYNYEAEAVGQYLREGQLESPVISLDESLGIMKLLDEVRAQWGFKYPFE
ncbi:Gfo/Idh/MocA family oxidoreductase [Paenibacillus zeisoli]|uniref:Gfo/Idh/MocA family oxidoreductase n=1 Tax=Paenibacillus zeisoli TaxID=2496267 RepID=A0A433X8X8_9BACL|nr:Gfo/Idh/MocA family oxidoreductase [Paenibacillus zeisoli]RUT30545.1 Gfo/Idh/MocA family oxidoreductase [Paenibacillus zeisoli]